MNPSILSSGTQEVLNDLVMARGLIQWQVVRDIRISTDSEEAVDLIYGNVVTSRLEDQRLDRTRKPKPAKVPRDEQPSTYCCFIVLPAISCFSIKRLLELQQWVDTNEPRAAYHALKRTFLAITDAANISYYVLQTPAILPM